MLPSSSRGDSIHTSSSSRRSGVVNSTIESFSPRPPGGSRTSQVVANTGQVVSRTTKSDVSSGTSRRPLFSPTQQSALQTLSNAPSAAPRYILSSSPPRDLASDDEVQEIIELPGDAIAPIAERRPARSESPDPLDTIPRESSPAKRPDRSSSVSASIKNSQASIMVDGSRRSSRVADRHAKEEADQAKRREERRKRKEKEAKDAARKSERESRVAEELVARAYAGDRTSLQPGRQRESSVRRDSRRSTAENGAQMANVPQSQAPAQPEPSSNTPKNLLRTNKTQRVKRTVIIDLDDEEAEGSEQPRASARPDAETEPPQPTSDQRSSLRFPASDLPSIEFQAPAPISDLSRVPESVSESRDSPIKPSFSQHERIEPRQPLKPLEVKQLVETPIHRPSPGPRSKEGRLLKPGGIQWRTCALVPSVISTSDRQHAMTCRLSSPNFPRLGPQACQNGSRLSHSTKRLDRQRRLCLLCRRSPQRKSSRTTKMMKRTRRIARKMRMATGGKRRGAWSGT